MKTVSVVIPCYNDGEYILEAIKSVLEQTYKNIQIIIIDDGSTDPYTKMKLNQIAPNIAEVVHVENGGPSNARNIGIKLAKGELILPLDSDDYIEKTYIEKAVNMMESDPTIGIVYCKATLFGDKNGPWNLPSYSIELMLKDNLIFVTAMFRKNTWERVGGFSACYKNGLEDYDFWLKIIELGYHVYQINEYLFFYRIKGKSRTQEMISSKEIFNSYDMIIDNHKLLYINNCVEVIKLIRKDYLKLALYSKNKKHNIIRRIIYKIKKLIIN